MSYNKIVFNRSLILCVLILLSAACVDLQGPELAPLKPEDVLADVSVGSDAVMIKIGDTLKLTATALAMNGAPIDIDNDNLIWNTVDPSQVQIDSKGSLIARATTVTPVNITVSYKYGPVTMVDTVAVTVTAAKLDVTDLKLVSLDSNRVGALAALGYPRVRAELYNGNNLVEKGARLPITVRYPVKVNLVLNGGPDGEHIYKVNNDLGFLGKFWVRSSVNLYGQIVSDSIEFLGLYPAVLSGMMVGSNFLTGEITPFARGYGGDRVNVQPCALIIVGHLDFFHGPADAVFSDSASQGDDCDPVSMSDLQEGLKSIGQTFAVNQFVTGGNFYGLSYFSIGVRRSSGIGTVEVYARNSATKQRYPIEIRYNSIDIGETFK